MIIQNLDEMKKMKLKIILTQDRKDRKAMSKKLCKYNAAFDYINKNLIVLSVTSGGVSIISFSGAIGIIFKCFQVLLLVQSLLLCFL